MESSWAPVVSYTIGEQDGEWKGEFVGVDGKMG